ncbi:MAG: hypothetical protein HQL39_15470 [Alphaproteobacteria bacterium]|nr:hypothetical protein [Alphaproteobacteria bacterium]
MKIAAKVAAMPAIGATIHRPIQGEVVTRADLGGGRYRIGVRAGDEVHHLVVEVAALRPGPDAQAGAGRILAGGLGIAEARKLAQAVLAGRDHQLPITRLVAELANAVVTLTEPGAP